MTSDPHRHSDLGIASPKVGPGTARHLAGIGWVHTASGGGGALGMRRSTRRFAGL